MRIPAKQYPKAKAFLDDIIEVYRKHGLSISHEDSHGGFIIEPLDEYNINWLRDADVELTSS